MAGNVRALARLAAPALFGAVVKADAYGHGLEATAGAAWGAGARYLCVATLDEALALRAAGHEGSLLVTYPVPPDAIPDAVHEGVEVVAGGENDVEALCAHMRADRVRTTPGVHVEVETGMMRGGLTAAVAPSAVARLLAAGVDVVGIWSHLAAPDDPDRTSMQAATYDATLVAVEAATGLRPLRHLSASGGLLHEAGTYDLVRVGLAMYGDAPDSAASSVVGLRPALELRARAVRFLSVPTGTPVGYSGTRIAERPSVIATLPLGYADGYARSLSPGACVRVGRHRVPIVGRISSDSMTVDATAVPGLNPLTEFEVISRHEDGPGVAELAMMRGTITWEILQTLSHRLPRVYRSGGRIVAVRDAVWMTPSAFQIARDAVAPGG